MTTTPQSSTSPALPARLPLLPAGDLRGLDGRAWLIVRERVLAALRSNGPIPLDVEHANHHDSRAPVAGVLSDFELAPNGAIDAAIEWNAYGAETFAAGGWSISPVILFDASTAYNTAGGSVSGTVRTITSAALTKTPNFLALAINSAEISVEAARITRLFGNQIEDLFPEHFPAEPNAASPTVLGPLQSISGTTADEIPERVTVLARLEPDHAQALGRRLTGRTIPVRSGPMPDDASVGALSEFVIEAGENRAAITAQLELNPSAVREFRSHAGPARLTPVLAVDRNSKPVDVVAAVWEPPQGVSLNAARGAAPMLNAEQQRICALFGNTPEDIFADAK